MLQFKYYKKQGPVLMQNRAFMFTLSVVITFLATIHDQLHVSHHCFG
jgi:hypothetical protein